MGRRQVPENQLTVLDMCLDVSNMVVQSNDFVNGRQNLSLNAAKLVRSAIMQIKPDSAELEPYQVTTPELAELFGVDKSNLYKTLENVTSEIMGKYIKISDNSGKWVKFHWVECCSYDGKVVKIQLYKKLKPYLLALKERYTQYELQYILAMKSVYAIRLYEILQSKIIGEVPRPKGADVKLTVEEIREKLGIEDNKYKQVGGIKSKVLDVAINEINRVSLYRVTYKDIKKGRFVVGFKFHVKLLI